VNVPATIAIGSLVILGAGALVGYGAHRRDIAAMDRSYTKVVAGGAPSTRRFDPNEVAHMPEIARRYFRYAIAPGTPLYSVVELDLEGTFLLRRQ
jgi:hypothetical protein